MCAIHYFTRVHLVWCPWMKSANLSETPYHQRWIGVFFPFFFWLQFEGALKTYILIPHTYTKQSIPHKTKWISFKAWDMMGGMMEKGG